MPVVNSDKHPKKMTAVRAADPASDVSSSSEVAIKIVAMNLYSQSTQQLQQSTPTQTYT
jgi:hypothetical protein